MVSDIIRLMDQSDNYRGTPPPPPAAATLFSSMGYFIHTILDRISSYRQDSILQTGQHPTHRTTSYTQDNILQTG